MSHYLILASQSPRRKELLSQLGYQFSCQPANIDESVIADECPLIYVERMARLKAECIVSALSADQPRLESNDYVVLGSDTCVVIDNEILAKPESLDDSMRILSRLSGNKHQVLTAISAMNGRKSVTKTVCTDVYFKTLTHGEISRYWQTGEPQDKAGSYGIQGIGGQFVTRIDGSYSAVVGLPLYETSQLLAEFGLASGGLQAPGLVVQEKSCSQGEG
jgi:septum formation protein